MKLGISSYCMYQAIHNEGMTILEAVEWAAANGAEHIEISPSGYSLVDTPELIGDIRAKAKEVGIELSNYAIGANFIQPDEASYRAELERVKQHVDIAHGLGVTRMRHDVASRPIPEATIMNYLADLPKLVEACQEIADYAAQYGITTSVENHGFYTQGSERVHALVHAVNRSNFRTLLDVGNFMCTDEDPVAAVKRNLPIASMVHLKDFYLRPSYRNPGEGWFRTASGNYLRGAIVGQGDIDMWEIIKLVKESGYNGYVSIEFEGLEPCRMGTKAGLDNARRIWDSI